QCGRGAKNASSLTYQTGAVATRVFQLELNPWPPTDDRRHSPMRHPRLALITLSLALLPLAALANPKVLICGADSSGGAGPDLQNKLTQSGKFAVVDLLDCGKNTPTLATLKMYEGVVLFDDAKFVDATTLGTNLADYVDAGGGVVQMMFNMY